MEKVLSHLVQLATQAVVITLSPRCLCCVTLKFISERTAFFKLQIARMLLGESYTKIMFFY